MALSQTVRRVMMIAAAVIVVVIVVVGVVVSRALSPEAIRPIAERELGTLLNQPVTIGSLDITLLPRPQVLGGTITIGDAGAAKAPSLQVAGLRIVPRLSSLLAGGVAIDLIEIKGLALAVRRDAEGQWYLPLGPATTTARPAGSPPSAASAPSEAPAAGTPVEIREIRMTGGRLTIVDDVLRSPSGSPEVASLTAIDALVRATGGMIQLESLKATLGGSTLTGRGEIGPTGTHLILNWDALATADLPELFGLVGTPPIEGLAVDGKKPLDLEVTVAPEGAAEITGMLRADRIAMGSLTVSEASTPIAYIGGKATANLKAARIALGTLTLSAVETPVVFDGTALAADPLTFAIYGGRERGRFTYTPGPAAAWTLVSNIDGIDVGAFLDANTSAKGRLSGTGSLDVNLRAPLEGELARTLAGKVGLAVTRGEIRDFALLAAVNNALGITGGDGKDTAFDQMSGTLTISGGRLDTRDLLLQMGELRVTAEGSLGLVDQALAFTGRGQFSKAKSDELTANAKDLRLLANAKGELEFPVKIGGTTAAPDFTIDLGKMAKTAATNAVKKELTKGLNRLLKKK